VAAAAGQLRTRRRRLEFGKGGGETRGEAVKARHGIVPSFHGAVVVAATGEGRQLGGWRVRVSVGRGQSRGERCTGWL
jgi:hypothetical protein